MFGGRITVFFFFFSCWRLGRVDGGTLSDIEKIEILVRQWAPLVWLAPDENFMPLNVEEFLENMNIVDERNVIVTKSKHSARFFKYNSKKFFLIPNKPFEKLKSNQSSFLYGRNPKNHSTIPVYAIVTYCVFPNSSDEEFQFPLFHVTYWMFYPFNEGKDVCFLGKVPAPLIFNKCLGHYRKLGNHIGDWEHISMSFSGKLFPEKLFISVHDTGAYYNFDKSTHTFKYEYKLPRRGVAQVPVFPEYVRLQGGHPVLFAAKGSHGLWSAPGDHEYIRVPRIIDETSYGTPWKTWASLKFYHIGKTEIPPWITFKGNWGNPKTKCILLKKLGLCEYTEGPKGLLRENQDFYC